MDSWTVVFWDLVKRYTSQNNLLPTSSE